MDGLLYFWPFALIALLTAVATCGLIVMGHKKLNIHAKSDKRRHHFHETPLLGGVGIILGIIFSGSALYFSQASFFAPADPKFILLALCTAGIFGVLDDLYEISARWKFLGQNLITLFLMLALAKVETPVDMLFGARTPLSYGIEWFWCLGLLNSINLIDGMDGLASGIGMIVLGFLCFTNHSANPTHIAFAAITTPAVLGFYFWNHNPAKIFLGESGAQCVAIALYLACMTYDSSPSPAINIVAPLFALGIPI